MESAVTALLNAGADAMDNLFDVEIALPADAPFPKRSGADAVGENEEDAVGTTKLRLRCQGFTPPHFSLRSYDVRYKTIKFKRPAAVIEGDRVFDLSFRLDAHYNTYVALARWRNFLMNPSSGYASNEIGTSEEELKKRTGVVTVRAAAAPVTVGESWQVAGLTDGDTIYQMEGSTAEWVFSNVWLMDLSDASYKVDGGGPIIITAKFSFGEFDDPMVTWYAPS